MRHSTSRRAALALAAVLAGAALAGPASANHVAVSVTSLPSVAEGEELTFGLLATVTATVNQGGVPTQAQCASELSGFGALVDFGDGTPASSGTKTNERSAGGGQCSYSVRGSHLFTLA